MPMVTVSLSPQQAAGIRDAVDDGSYASSSEVVREALQLWNATREVRSRRTRARSPFGADPYENQPAVGRVASS